MRFTVASPGAVLPPPPPVPQPRLAPLGHVWKDWTSPGVYEVAKAVTADGEWLFELAVDGTWMTGHLPTRTEVNGRLRSLHACRAYAGSGQAAEDLERLRAEGKGDGNG